MKQFTSHRRKHKLQLSVRGRASGCRGDGLHETSMRPCSALLCSECQERQQSLQTVSACFRVRCRDWSSPASSYGTALTQQSPGRSWGPALWMGNTETTGCAGSSRGKEQFNLTLTFPVRTEGNSVSNLLLKPNLENKRDKQNIFHLTSFVSLHKKNINNFVLKKIHFFCPYIYINSIWAFNPSLYKLSRIIHKLIYKTEKYHLLPFFNIFKSLKAQNFFYDWMAPSFNLCFL